MGKMRGYVIAIGIMIATSMVSLVVVSVLTYWFKWQADKAMIGIIITYVLAGFAGGNYLSKRMKEECRKSVFKKIAESTFLATIFILFSIVGAYVGFQILFVFSRRFLLVWLLIICSSFVAMCMKR